MIWRACERFDILPPEFPKVHGRLRWDDLSEPQQAYLLGYHQTAEHDVVQRENEAVKAATPKMPKGRRKK